ncbi:unnamed protein product, partial [Discosporangium mesarthrocarpum]
PANGGPLVTSIISAAGEVGSGTAGAAGGKHFSKITPSGLMGHPEQRLEGVEEGEVEVVEIKPRSKEGAFLTSDAKV